MESKSLFKQAQGLISGCIKENDDRLRSINSALHNANSEKQLGVLLTSMAVVLGTLAALVSLPIVAVSAGFVSVGCAMFGVPMTIASHMQVRNLVVQKNEVREENKELLQLIGQGGVFPAKAEVPRFLQPKLSKRVSRQRRFVGQACTGA